MSKRHSWKKNPNHFLSLDFFFQKWRLLISQKAIFGILAGFFFQEWRLLISRLLDFFSKIHG